MSVNQNPPEVRDRESATGLIAWCTRRLGLGYHPDTPFADYADGDGRPVFSQAQAQCLDALTLQAFAYCDPYETSLTEMGRPTVGVGMEGEWCAHEVNPGRSPTGQSVLSLHEPADPFVMIVDPAHRPRLNPGGGS